MQPLFSLIGLLLTALGPIFYFLSPHKSPTAFIPTGIGLAILVLSLVARDPAKRKLAVHLALVFALLGFVGALGRSSKILDGFAQRNGASPIAAWESVLMALLCLVYLVAGVMSFIEARRKK